MGQNSIGLIAIWVVTVGPSQNLIGHVFNWADSYMGCHVRSLSNDDVANMLTPLEAYQLSTFGADP